MKESTIFALDVGTRSVIGVVMEESARGFEIIASEYQEHQHHAMIDGQIHDIGQVAEVVKQVKEKLEAKVGYELTSVAVAAAGRALKTVRAKVTLMVEDFDEIKHDEVLRLELQGVQKAQEELAGKAAEEGDVIYNCVGYSVVHYELDGYKMKNLVDQKGREMAVDLIATFLPRVVVDSLFAVLQKAGLEMSSLTLEPIAASTVVVPSSMRQLNIALVDIGAGTSDIAITSDGSIVGYGMVPCAGDEITEEISHLYLVDFYQAEIIKRKLSEVDVIEFEDVLGNLETVKTAEVLTAIEEKVEELATQICDKILFLNQKPPQAVICIGGGALTPLLKQKLAESLSLSQQRVAVRGRDAIREVQGTQNLAGPEAVTPIGIAVTAFKNKGLGFAKVTVNGMQVRLFEVNKGTVGDCLLAAGIDMKKLMPRLGLALTVTVNGKLEIIRGTRGTPASILLNGREVPLDAPIRHGDVIEFVAAENGIDATGRVKDVLPFLQSFKVGINNKAFEVKPIITMNDENVDFETELVDNAKIVYNLPKTVGEVLELAGYTGDISSFIVTVNGKDADMLYELQNGDSVTISRHNQLGLNWDGQPITTNSVLAEVEPLTEAEPLAEADIKTDTDVLSNQTTVYVNDKEVIIPRDNLILTDIFTKIDFPLTPPGPGARLRMSVNGVLAEFTTPLSFGDRIELGWEGME